MLAAGLKQAIKDCEIDDTREASLAFLIDLAARNGIPVVNPPAMEEKKEEEKPEDGA